MPEIVFLLGDVALARHDNHQRLPRAFERAGWRVATQPQEAVRLEPGGVRFGHAHPEAYQLIWLIGMGRALTFLDRMQLLRLLPQERFVVNVDALVYRHAKYPWTRHMPETYASSDPAFLRARVASGGEWVAKPAAGSYGRDVVYLSPEQAGRGTLQRLTAGGAYCLLQRFVPDIARGEKRTLVAGGRIIGSYLRVPGDLHANLAAGGTPHPTTLTPDEQTLVAAVAEELVCHGIGFAAVDTVFPYLMEVNLANPGGLATLESLYGRDFTGEVVSAVADWRRSG